MGNNLFLNFNLEKNELMKGGFKNMWKIYKGINKISNKKICAFICDKNALPSNLTIESKESYNLEKINHETIENSGIEYIYYEDEVDKGIVWNNGEYSYTISGNITKNELLKIAESIL